MQIKVKLKKLWTVNLQHRRQEHTIWGEKSMFGKWCWKTWAATCKSMKLEHIPHTIHKNKLKMTYRCIWLFVTPWTVHGILQTGTLEWVAFPFSRGSSQPRDWTQVSRIAGGFFTSWATGKPKNTGLGSLSILQQIFPMQGSNPGLPHCRRIIYQLSVIIYYRSSWKLIKPDFWEHPGHIPETIRKASWYFCYSEM